ncbi:MAG: hypothetical protein V3V14_05575 [Saprospiraceae bacterium]
MIAIFITSESKIKFINKRLGGFIVWLSSIAILILVLTTINKIRNLSPILISSKFYWEEGLDIEFRKNGTYKALNHDMFGGEMSYGKYVLKDSLIILKDKVKFGLENLSDTLIISNKGISFIMEKEWRINDGVMSFVYLPISEIDIVNKTTNKIDSLSVKTYTKAQISVVSISPNQNIVYKFDMKNPHVNGKYKLSYKIGGQLYEHKNILDGYPLEMINTIEFEDNSINLNLISGITIKLNYF